MKLLSKKVALAMGVAMLGTISSTLASDDPYVFINFTVVNHTNAPLTATFDHILDQFSVNNLAPGQSQSFFNGNEGIQCASGAGSCYFMVFDASSFQDSFLMQFNGVGGNPNDYTVTNTPRGTTNIQWTVQYQNDTPGEPGDYTYLLTATVNSLAAPK